MISLLYALDGIILFLKIPLTEYALDMSPSQIFPIQLAIPKTIVPLPVPELPTASKQ